MVLVLVLALMGAVRPSLKVSEKGSERTIAHSYHFSGVYVGLGGTVARDSAQQETGDDPARRAPIQSNLDRR